MTTDEVLAVLKDRGLSVTLANGQPKVAGPREQLTSELLRVLKLHRDEIIRRLGGDPTAPPASTAPEPTTQETAPEPEPAVEPPPVPPLGRRLYYYDLHGLACGPTDAYAWTWEGGPRWFHVTEYPVPLTRAEP